MPEELEYVARRSGKRKLLNRAKNTDNSLWNFK
jgi:hypothetical protein